MFAERSNITCLWYALAALLLVAVPAAGQQPDEWHASAWQLWRIDVDGSHLQPLDTSPDERCGSPVWSPDGKFIAYDVLSLSGGGYEVAVIRADGTDRRIICQGSIPSWSPDGKLIVCQGRGMQVMNADGNGNEVLPGRAWSLRWSPHGNRIASSSGGAISFFDLATGIEREIFSGPNQISHGYGISPDGLRFCFGSPNAGLSVATLDERKMQATARPLVTTGTAYHASWAPDGKHVVFAWRPSDQDLTQLYTLDVDTNDSPKLLPGIDTSHQNVNPAWSPDGKSIVFSQPMALVNP